jgi:Na+/alanine symporter
MLEILILISLCRQIGERAREKGKTAGIYQFMLVIFWFGGEIGAALLTGIILAIAYGSDFQNFFCFSYIAAFVGAAFSAWVAFQIVKSLPDPEPKEEGWD